MELQRTDAPDVSRLVITGPVDAYEAAMLSDAIREEIERRPRLILLEFTGNSFVSATIIGLLIWLQRLARSVGAEIVLVRPPRLLCRSLGFLRAVPVFRTVETVEAGDATLGNRAA